MAAESATEHFYAAQYARFDDPVAAEIRREVYGRDFGEQGWRSLAEQEEIEASGVALRPAASLTSLAAPAARR